MSEPAVVVDTGALYALLDTADRWHSRVIAWWKDNTRPLVVPAMVLPETTYLLQTRISAVAESAFVRAVADGEFPVEPLEREDMPRVLELMERYADLPLGFVDATVVALADRLGTREVLTTDRRHFGVVRLRHGRAMTVLP